MKVLLIVNIKLLLSFCFKLSPIRSMKKNTILIILIFFSLVSKSQTAGQLKATVTTVAVGGNYSPYNVFAVWVQSKTGVFVKTMLADAALRRSYLSNWGKATASTYNVVDAITGATQGSHGTYTCSWNGTNLTGTVLGDDTYTVALEMTEGGTPVYTTFQFKKSGTEQIVTPANVTGFSNITIKWSPASTPVETVMADKLFTVFPNPAKNNVYVSGFGISEMQVLDLNGKLILSTRNQFMDISSLKKGNYFLKISSLYGAFSKQIIKN